MVTVAGFSSNFKDPDYNEFKIRMIAGGRTNLSGDVLKMVAGARKIFILLFNKVETEELIFLNFFNDLVYKQE